MLKNNVRSRKWILSISLKFGLSSRFVESILNVLFSYMHPLRRTFEYMFVEMPTALEMRSLSTRNQCSGDFSVISKAGIKAMIYCKANDWLKIYYSAFWMASRCSNRFAKSIRFDWQLQIWIDLTISINKHLMSPTSFFQTLLPLLSVSCFRLILHHLLHFILPHHVMVAILTHCLVQY